jgi:hypothetical protein
MDIMKHLESVGIATDDRDKKERGRIATFLSTVHCFKSHNRAGWRYIPAFDDERPEPTESQVDEAIEKATEQA